MQTADPKPQSETAPFDPLVFYSFVNDCWMARYEDGSTEPLFI